LKKKKVPLQKEFETEYGTTEKDDVPAGKRDVPDAEKAASGTSQTSE
jgi:hypothetical protein